MKKYVLIYKQDGEQLPLKVRQCRSFLCRLRGLMFRRKLKPAEALLFEEKNESLLGASIHMFFVFFPIAVIWMRADGCVVDTVLAKPFHPYYAPAAPAKFFLEGPPFLMDNIRKGMYLSFVPFENRKGFEGE